VTVTAGPRHVVLVGLSGSGKSTVGRLLAARLGRVFVDTDDLVVALAGCSIPDLFASEGEKAFRAVERRAVAGAVGGPPAVIATGGGAPTDETNRAALWEGNLVVWLDAPVEVLATRVGVAGAGRPLLAGGAAERLAGLAEARRPVYATAHLRLETDGRPPEAVAAEIVAALEETARVS
jgi:shikimate kinase